MGGEAGWGGAAAAAGGWAVPVGMEVDRVLREEVEGMGLREERVAATPGRLPDSHELTPLVVESVLKLSARPLLRCELSLLLRSSL